ncbi:MAG TPA: helix-turn-helix transcriptional regulator [Thermoanaerobaculia bacterium]|nr:helix-turn-helix transcriptional regulator [Thermoanaerobaculia bacterium]
MKTPADRIAERYQDSDPARLVNFLAMGSLIEEVVSAIRAAEAKGITRYRLSKDSGVDQAVISRLVSGETRVNVENLEKLCEALGLQVTVKRKPRKR